MESGVTTPSALLDDDGRLKRTGIISLSILILISNFSIFSPCISHAWFLQSPCYLV